MVKVKKGKKVAEKGKKGEPGEAKEESVKVEAAAKAQVTAKPDAAEETKPREPTAEEVKLRQEAVKEILAGLAKPEGEKGNPFIPFDWSKKYKPVLGPYKKFVLAQSDTFTVHERPNQASWVVTKKGEEAPPEPAKSAQQPLWKKQLENAWSTYCSVTPAHERSIEVFTSALPKVVKQTKATPQQKSTDPTPAEEPGSVREKAKRKVTEAGEDATKKPKKKAKKKAAPF